MTDQFSVEINDAQAHLRLEIMPTRVRENLRSVAEAYEAIILGRARSKAPVRSGSYLRSIRGKVIETQFGVYASVRAGNARARHAHLVERGANIPPHVILPKAKQMLRFNGSAGQIFASKVRSPGGRVPAQNIIGGAFEASRSDLVAAMKDAVSRGTQ